MRISLCTSDLTFLARTISNILSNEQLERQFGISSRESCHLDKISDFADRAPIAPATLFRGVKRNRINGEHTAQSAHAYIILPPFVFDRRNFLGESRDLVRSCEICLGSSRTDTASLRREIDGRLHQRRDFQ